MRQLRQPRLAEIVAIKLRDDILTGRLKEGDSLPRQEHLFTEFRVSLPAVREAMRILETDGLVSVRRGNVGGAVVHLPTPARIARAVSMVLQTRHTNLGDVRKALLHLEPTCAGLCAGRPDRDTAVIPVLRDIVDEQHRTIDADVPFSHATQAFHRELVRLCGNETMVVVFDALTSILSAHDTKDCDADDNAVPDRKARRNLIREHQKIMDAISDGNPERATKLVHAHLSMSAASASGSIDYTMVDTNTLDSTLD